MTPGTYYIPMEDPDTPPTAGEKGVGYFRLSFSYVDVSLDHSQSSSFGIDHWSFGFTLQGPVMTEGIRRLAEVFEKMWT